MSQPRRAKRRDNHHAEIRDGLRQLGYFVADLADVGNGLPDLLAVSKTRIAVLMEIKTYREDFTLAERKFFEDYMAPHVVVFDMDGAASVMAYYDGFMMECK